MLTPALLAAWQGTRVEILGPHGLQVIESISDAVGRARVDAFGTRGHVVTAWNPGARVLTTQENAARHADLREVVASAGLVGLPATGRACDGTWHEQGVFLPARGTLADARETALALGRAFGQLGIYEIDAGELRALACADGSVVAPCPTTAGAFPAG